MIDNKRKDLKTLLMSKEDQRLLEYYAQTASQYDQQHGENVENCESLRFISAMIATYAISSILDIGCGTGRGIQWLQDHHSIKVYGIDPSPDLLLQAAGKKPAKSLFIGSGKALPFKDKAFDAVCELGVLHHVKNPYLVIKEMMRVAQKAIFISDSNRFGQGCSMLRLIKLLLFKIKLWNLANLIKTLGKGYNYSNGDGISYSYSVYDSYKLLALWADRIILIPTAPQSLKTFHQPSWFTPLLTSDGVLLCALKEQ